MGGARMRARVLPLALLVLGFAVHATAAEPDHSPAGTKGGWVDLVATGFVGDGLRFNNPFRLATVLGSQAQSLSRTAAYGDLGLGVLLGDPTFLAHGPVLRTTFAAEGVAQSVITPSYLVMHRWTEWAVYGRLGAPVVLTPDVTYGFEGGAGGVWFARAGLGAVAEIVGDVFYGAGTREVSTPAYPVLSVQFGVWLSWEALP
ncbi:MAG: hypothetical protein ACRELB_17590 [Polyangiaceae bacterium]